MTEVTTTRGGAIANMLEPVSPMDAVTMAIARGESIDIGALERLVALKERTDAQMRKERFEAALNAAQAEMPRVGKNGTVSLAASKGYSYAYLEDVDACIRKIYEKHGFSVRFDAPATSDGKIRITAHVSAHGHTVPTEITVPPDTGPGRSPVQAVKASITAARRHLLEMFFNVIEVGADELGSGPTITQAQADSLRDALAEVGGNIPAFLKAYGNLSRLEDMRASLLNKAWDQINAKRGRK